MWCAAEVHPQFYQVRFRFTPLCPWNCCCRMFILMAFDAAACAHVHVLTVNFLSVFNVMSLDTGMRGEAP